MSQTVDRPCGTVSRNGHPPWHIVPGQNLTGLKVANSLTGEKEDFIPAQGKKVNWYVCGPTVYDHAHMGHARAVLTFDILRRVMEDYFGYEVVYQTNVTDIDDKIILKSRRNYIVDNYAAENKSNVDKVTKDTTEAVKLALEKAEKKVQEMSKTEGLTEREASERKTLLAESELKLGQARDIVTAVAAAAKAKDVEGMLKSSRDALAEQLDEVHKADVPIQKVFADHARKFERFFWEDTISLGCRLPNAITRVTEYVPDCVTFIEKIIANGNAYASNGSVYFDTTAFKKGHSYPKLVPGAGQKATAAEMAEGEGALSSGFTDEKKHPNDFALWKKSKVGEPIWASPWGEGRPGWHIECSVMATDVLGGVLDIHGGGSDLKFPHHDNEMAQSEAYHDCQQWVNYWFHCGHLHIKGLKMSKSLKNFITIRQALEFHTARQIRIMFLHQAWDKGMDYGDQTLNVAKDFERRLNSFFGTVKALQRQDWVDVDQRWGDREKVLCAAVVKAEERVHVHLCDNFNTPEVMQEISALMTAVYKYMDGETKVLGVVEKAAKFVTKILRVLGVVEGADDVGFAAAGGAEDSKFAPIMDAFTAFRDLVRGSLKDEDLKKAILAACDDVRDNTLVDLGVRLEDRPGKPSLWKEESADALRAEQVEKAQLQAEQAQKKVANKVAEKAKEIAKWEGAAPDPMKYFSVGAFEGKYTEARNEKGLPTHLVEGGEEVPKKQMKSNEKEHEKRVKLHDDFNAKGGSALLEQLRKEMAELETQMKALTFAPGGRGAAN